MGKRIYCVILNYNSTSVCKRCIADLRQQRAVELVLIVVDNASRANELEALKTFCSGSEIILLESKGNRGYSAGNNIGLRYAAEHGAELALIANPDMEFPDKDYLAKLTEAFDADDDVVVAASDIVDAAGVHINPQPPERGWRSAFQWLSWKVDPEKNRRKIPFAESGACAKVAGCCFMIRLDFAKNIGFFDEYPFLYCEEAILAAQVVAAEKKMFYLADASAIHRHVDRPQSDPLPKFRQLRRSRIYYHRHYTQDNFFCKWLAVLSYDLWYVCAFVTVKLRSAGKK